MQQEPQVYTIWDAVTPQAVTSSTDASPVVVTKASHGYNTGDRVMIYGHATNIAINGIYTVVKINSSTFSLQDITSGAAINGSGAGAGSGGVVVIAPKTVLAVGFKSIQFELQTTGGANFTLKFANSFGRTESGITNVNRGVINFGAAPSPSNPYSFVQCVDLNTGSPINGTVGIAPTGTDINNMYELNTNGGGTICPILTAWSAGVITLRAKLFHFGE